MTLVCVPKRATRCGAVKLSWQPTQAGSPREGLTPGARLPAKEILVNVENGIQLDLHILARDGNRTYASYRWLAVVEGDSADVTAGLSQDVSYPSGLNVNIGRFPLRFFI